jgi:hypothetical protein
VGAFPPEAYRASAYTAYDAAWNMFACHMSGLDRPSTCAGFLLVHASHSLGARMAQVAGRVSGGVQE